MEEKKIVKGFCVLTLVITLLTLGLGVLYNSAFIASFLLMLSLFLFGVCYYIKDEKKNLMYILFICGVLLIISSLVYTYIRIR